MERYSAWLSRHQPETSQPQLQFMVACCVIGALVGTISILATTSGAEVLLLSGFVLIVGGLPLLIRLQWPVNTVKLLAALFVAGFLTVMALMPPELETQQLFWFGLLPLSGGLMFGNVGIRAGGYGALVLVMVCVGLHQLGLNFGIAITHSLASVVVDVTLFILAVMGMTRIYERLYAHAVARTEATMRARSLFLAQMSHELRTPMNGVLGIVKVMDLDAPKARQREMLSMIQRSGEAMVALIDELLDQARLDAGRLQIASAPFAPDEVIKDVTALFMARAQTKGLRLVCQIEESVPPCVNADRLRFRQILQNLVSNAIKFTGSGSVTMTLRWADGRLHGAVTDTGIGLSEDQIEKVFRPFEQVSAETAKLYGGSGLGLMISRSLCRLMSGDLTVTSALGQGSCFAFHLSAPVAMLSQDPQRVAEGEERFIGHVLVVEDNLINQRVSQLMCERLGLSVDIAGDGVAALEALSNTTYDLVLMDCMMPRMDGFEATRHIRRLPPPRDKIPVIALTASVMHEDVERCLQVGMDDVLAKPLNESGLADILRRYMADTRRSCG
ncbi:MAG: response regulator [Myxococcota bacterium]